MKKYFSFFAVFIFALLIIASCDQCPPYPGAPSVKHIITATAGPGGTIDPTTIAVEKGSDITFNFNPSPGYVVDTVFIDGVSITSTLPYTFANVQTVHTIQVSFIKTTTLVVSPTTLVFSGLEASNNLSISNGGNGTLNWSLSESIPWLSLYPESGSQNGTVTIDIDRTSLTPETYTGTVSISSNGGNQDIPVTMTVSQPTGPILQVLPSSLSFGLTDVTKTLAISNLGIGDLNWSITESISWLEVLPASGTGNSTPTLQIDKSGLENGRYSDSIQVTSNGGDSSVSISMEVRNTVLSVSPESLDFGTNPSGTSKAFVIENTGGGTLNWSLSEIPEWLSVDSQSGTNRTTITATINKSGKDAGTYNGAVLVTSNGGNKSVNVSMVVRPAAFSLSNTSFDFGSAATSNAFEITNTGEGNLTWGASESIPWLSVSPSEGNIIGGNHRHVTISVDRSGVESGSHSGTITITSNVGSQPISISMTVLSPILNRTPSSLDFGTSSTSKSLTISNTGQGVLRWNASESASWLSLSATSGTGGSVITVQATRSPSLESATYTSSISITSNGGNLTVPVSMTIPSPILSVTPSSLNLGSTSTSQSITIRNNGGGILRWTATPRHSYLSVSPSSGTTSINPDSDAATITLNRSGLASGTYQSGVTISSSNGGTQEITISFTVWETLFNENFNDGEFWVRGRWAIGNNNTMTTSKWGTSNYTFISSSGSMFCSDNGDNYRSTYDNGLNTYMQKQNLDFSNYSSLELSFCYWLNSETSYDKLEVNIKGQNGSWTTVLSESGRKTSFWNASSPKKISLSQYAGQRNIIISFDFVSDSSLIPSGEAGAWIDDVKLIGLKD